MKTSTVIISTSSFIFIFLSSILWSYEIIGLSRRLTICRKNNKKRKRKETNKKLVAVAPQIAPFEIAEEPANWGDSISVVCAILKGDLPIEITWALNGEPIRPDRSDINILATTRKNSILSIESVAARHAGEYTCSASNKAGATSHSTILAVNGTSRPRYFLCYSLLNLHIPSLLIIIRYYPSL